MSRPDDYPPVPLNYAISLPRRPAVPLGRVAWVCIVLQFVSCLVAFGWSDLAIAAVRRDVPPSDLWGRMSGQYDFRCVTIPAIFGAIAIVLLSIFGIISALRRRCSPGRLLGIVVFGLGAMLFMLIGLMINSSDLYP